MMIKNINEKIQNHALLVFTIFLFLQPVLDIVTGITIYYFKSEFTLSSIIRILFLLFAIYYILFICKDKSKKMLFVLFIYSVFFILGNLIFKENNNLIFEIKNLFNNIYLPISLLFVLNILKNNNFNKKNIFIILILYLIFTFIPNILNIGFNSYAYSKTGSVGFFYSANAIGSIISIICPLLICDLVLNKKIMKLFIFIIIYFYVLLTIGTKAPLLCSGIIILYYLIIYIIKLIKNKKYINLCIMAFIILILTILLINILPYTPFYKNLLIHLNFLKIKKLSDLLTFKNIDHFIFSSRLSFFKNTFNIFLNSSIYQKLFGIGYVLNGKILKLSEMDYLDTFIHQGIIGFIVIYIVYFKCLFCIFRSYLNNFKINFLNIKNTSIIISIIISILCALLTGHVLATPQVSIFVCLLLSIYYKELCEVNNNEKI